MSDANFCKCVKKCVNASYKSPRMIKEMTESQCCMALHLGGRGRSFKEQQMAFKDAVYNCRRADHDKKMGMDVNYCKDYKRNLENELAKQTGSPYTNEYRVEEIKQRLDRLEHI
jgi:hypothetical protein